MSINRKLHYIFDYYNLQLYNLILFLFECCVCEGGDMKSRRAVLVIEDASPVREALCSVLESDGFEVSGCADGTSALVAAAEKDFHIIITDYHMPNMNGADAIKHLRKRFPLSIIIGISSDDRGEDFLLAGADAFLSKPYRYDDLANLINSR